MKQFFSLTGHVIIQSLEPVSTKGMCMEDLPQLVDRVKSEMEKTYKELTKEVFNNLPADCPNYLADMNNS